MRLALKAIIKTCLPVLLIVFSVNYCRAQQPSVGSNEIASKKESSDLTNKTRSGSADTRYRIGPGDVIEVRVARAPELSREAVRVDQSGMIRMPMLDLDIPAACLTEAELAQNIAKLYKKYKNDPHVEVFVKEYQSQPVAVIGAVRGPAQFKLQR